ncbi:MAG: electron transport complex subunit RsxC [Candidatus Cloacimonetes bacterium]|nr:electron transport complex subunit RsxC [Candidatus Cloacimonadota bacterium]
MKTFPGGVHPEDFKFFSRLQKIQTLPLPKRVVILLSQHIGGLSKPIVKVGDTVRTGEKISEASSFVSIPMHASISGTVTAIANFSHPTGTMVQGIEIVSDGEDKWVDLVSETDYDWLTIEEMKERIREAGVCGMGGAGFPTVVKLSPPPDKPIDTVIVNGVECEPYLTTDCRMMVERPGDIITGLKIVMKILGAKQGIIGIESNKPQSIKILREMTKKEPNIRVDALKLKYPQGAEKQLIYATTKRKVPNKGGLPSSVGVVVDNVGTIINIYEAVYLKKPLVERVVTVTGRIVRQPSNIVTRIGTPFTDLIDYCKGTSDEIAKVISGGPMMGYTLSHLDAVVTKTVSGILLFDNEEAHTEPETSCIRCARCVDACPQNLVPSLIASYVQQKDFTNAEKVGLLDCMRCGCCTFVCPAHTKFTQWVDIGKLAIQNEKNKSKQF